MPRKKSGEPRFDESIYPIVKEKLWGHKKALLTLEKALLSGSVASTILLSGPSRVGKTSLAYILSAALECENPTPWACGECSSCKKIKKNIFPDLKLIALEMSESGKLKSRILVEQVRKEILEPIELPPYEGKKLIFIIEPAEALNVSSQNALLKVLEEPPSYANFILIARDFGPLLPTVRSRCREIHLSEISDEEMEKVADKLDVRDGRKEALEVSRGKPGILISGGWEDYISLKEAIEQLLLLGSDYSEFGRISPFLEVLLEYPPLVVLDEALFIAREILREGAGLVKKIKPLYKKIYQKNGKERLYEKIKALLDAPPLLVRNVQPKLVFLSIFTSSPKNPDM